MPHRMTTSPKVLIIQAEMKHYRVPFFEGLYAALQRDGIELTVLYSNSNLIQELRKDSAELDRPVGRRVTGRWFFNRFLYQSVWKEVFASDLVIVGSEVKFLINPMLILMSKLGLKTVAFWGLGPNRHPDRSPFVEWIKQHFFTCADWYFAYTDSIAEYLKKKGMPARKVTNVQNATDTDELKELIAKIPQEDAIRAKEGLTGSQKSQIGLYCGVLAGIKALPLLLSAARLVKAKYPEFHLVMIGDGPDRSWLQSAIAGEPWIHYLGFKNHEEGALYYKMADVFLLAGTVGLAVVDSFAAGLPLIATQLTTHPPEISYVVHGYNGYLASHEANALANAIVEVLSNPALKEQLRQGAVESGEKYTMGAMVDNFRLGVKQCLGCYGGSTSPQIAKSFTTRSNS
jgi:glycosyltransferase involved in cell wall biosynthesis